MKLICIKDDEWPAWARAVMNEFPVKGKIYTLREIQPGVIGETPVKNVAGNNPLQFTGSRTMHILVEELKNPKHEITGIELGFRADRFAELPETPKEKAKANIKNPVTPVKMPSKPHKPKVKELQPV